MIRMILHYWTQIRIGDPNFLDVIETPTSQQRLALVTYNGVALLQYLFE